MSSAYYKNLIRQKEKELSDYKKRRSQLDGIKRDYIHDFSGNANQINYYCEKVANSIQSAIVSERGNCAYDFRRNTEYGLNDYNMNASYESFLREERRVRDIITELELEIRRLYRMKNQAEEQERKEKEKALKELLGVD